MNAALPPPSITHIPTNDILNQVNHKYYSIPSNNQVKSDQFFSNECDVCAVKAFDPNEIDVKDFSMTNNPMNSKECVNLKHNLILKAFNKDCGISALSTDKLYTTDCGILAPISDVTSRKLESSTTPTLIPLEDDKILHVSHSGYSVNLLDLSGEKIDPLYRMRKQSIDPQDDCDVKIHSDV